MADDTETSKNGSNEASSSEDEDEDDSNEDKENSHSKLGVKSAGSCVIELCFRPSTFDSTRVGETANDTRRETRRSIARYFRNKSAAGNYLIKFHGPHTLIN